MIGMKEKTEFPSILVLAWPPRWCHITYSTSLNIISPYQEQKEKTEQCGPGIANTQCVSRDKGPTISTLTINTA